MTGASRRFGSGVPLVFDTSAWVRQRDPSVSEYWQATLAEDLLASCPVVSLEVLAGARDEAAFVDLDTALGALPSAPLTAAVTAAAIGAARALSGSRRLPAADYLIAAAAAERGFGVLHYDRHFDVLAAVLPIESVWVAPAGTIA